MADAQTVAAIIGSVVVGSSALIGGMSWAVRKFHRFNARFDEFMEDWRGTEARPGVPHRPGVMERLSQQDSTLQCIDNRLVAVELEINNNGGKSIKDVVGRLDGNLRHVKTVVDDLNNRVGSLEVTHTTPPAVRPSRRQS